MVDETVLQCIQYVIITIIIADNMLYCSEAHIFISMC